MCFVFVVLILSYIYFFPSKSGSFAGVLDKTIHFDNLYSYYFFYYFFTCVSSFSGGARRTTMDELDDAGVDRREMRERMLRLERENARLRGGGSGDGGAGEDEEGDGGGGGGGGGGGSEDTWREKLEDEKRLKKRFQQDSMEANARAEALETELAMLKESGTTGGASSVAPPPPAASGGVSETELRNMEHKYEMKMKNIIDKFDRLKKKNDEERSKNATMKHSMIELEQQLGDLMEEKKQKDSESTGQDAAHQSIMDGLKKSLREKETECEKLATEKSKLEKYVQRALQATQLKYKSAVSGLQAKSDEAELKLKEANAKVRYCCCCCCCCCAITSAACEFFVFSWYCLLLLL